MVSDPFEAEADAHQRKAAEAGLEVHNFSSAQRVIMQQPEDVAGQQAQLAAQRAKYGYGDLPGLLSDDVAKARGAPQTAWHGAWHGMAWHGMAWHGMAWHDMALHGMAWHCMALHRIA